MRAPVCVPVAPLPFVNSPPSILVGLIGEVFWLRIDDKGRMQNSVCVSQVVQDQIARGVSQFVIDLERCPTMDSTFLGTLKSVSRDVSRLPAGRLTVININARNLQLMTNLGLNHLLALDVENAAFIDERRQVATELERYEQSCDLSKQEQAQHVLGAHESLAEISAENASRFKDVIVFLRRDLDRHSGDGSCA